MLAGNDQSKPERKRGPQKMLSPFLRIALLVGVCVHLAGFLIFRVISSPLPQRPESLPFVQYVSEDALLAGAEFEEQAALFDSSPLFVPGPWNAAHNLQPPSRDRALHRFPAYAPEIDFSSALAPGNLVPQQTYAVNEPIDLLALRYWDLFRGFGESEAVPVALQSTGIFAEVRSLSGKVLRTVPVSLEQVSLQAIQPVAYFLRVEAVGRAVGRPTLSESSGDAAFDAAAYTYLVESGFVSDLPSGVFEIRVYP
jgi:hypothetical protein